MPLPCPSGRSAVFHRLHPLTRATLLSRNGRAPETEERVEFGSEPTSSTTNNRAYHALA